MDFNKALFGFIRVAFSIMIALLVPVSYTHLMTLHLNIRIAVVREINLEVIF